MFRWNDDQRNTDRSYDDFAEICAVVHKMDNIVNDAYQLIVFEIDYVNSEEFEDCSDWFALIDNDIQEMYDVLENRVGDNANLNIILDKVFPAYGEFIVSFAKTNSAYSNLRNARRSTYYIDQMVDSAHEAIDGYAAARIAFDTFFDEYCSYRDIGLFD